MSSSARAVLLGTPAGIFLLTKWITCAFTGGRPVEAGGWRVCARCRQREESVAQPLRPEAPVDHQLCAPA